MQPTLLQTLLLTKQRLLFVWGGYHSVQSHRKLWVLQTFCCTFLHICSALLAIDWTLEHLAMVYWLIKHFKVQLPDHRNNKICVLLCRLWKFGHAHHSCGLITYKYVVSHLSVQQSISVTPDITSLLGQMTGWHYLLNESLQPIIILLVWSNWRFQQIEVSGVYCKLKETFR